LSICGFTRTGLKASPNSNFIASLKTAPKISIKYLELNLTSSVSPAYATSISSDASPKSGDLELKTIELFANDNNTVFDFTVETSEILFKELKKSLLEI